MHIRNRAGVQLLPCAARDGRGSAHAARAALPLSGPVMQLKYCERPRRAGANSSLCFHCKMLAMESVSFASAFGRCGSCSNRRFSRHKILEADRYPRQVISRSTANQAISVKVQMHEHLDEVRSDLKRCGSESSRAAQLEWQRHSGGSEDRRGKTLVGAGSVCARTSRCTGTAGPRLSGFRVASP